MIHCVKDVRNRLFGGFIFFVLIIVRLLELFLLLIFLVCYILVMRWSLLFYFGGWYRCVYNPYVIDENFKQLLNMHTFFSFPLFSILSTS